MEASDILIDAAQRSLHSVEQVLGGISAQTLHTRPNGQGNSIAWLVWHSARQMDAQLAHLRGGEQEWVTGDWASALGVDRGPHESGFGDDVNDVASIQVVDPSLLQAYLRTCVEAFVAYLASQSAQDLDTVIDTSWDPPVTAGVRMVSIIDDAVAHLAQAAYARGLIDGWRIGY